MLNAESTKADGQLSLEETEMTQAISAHLVQLINKTSDPEHIWQVADLFSRLGNDDKNIQISARPCLLDALNSRVHLGQPKS